MARSLDPGFVIDPDDARWRSDEGWPYPDADELEGVAHDPADPDAEPDEDLVSLHGLGAHLLDGLSELERAVIAGRFGLDGRPPRSMRQLQGELGLDRAQLRLVLGDAMAMIRRRLTG
jgi:DNA-directed RNA polymerase sigma subunit (sigma70/sigma32)